MSLHFSKQLNEYNLSNISNFVDIAIERAKISPNSIAYTFLQNGETEEVNLTYKELDRRAQVIATHLQDLGQFGDRAFLLYSSGLEFIEALFGCLYAGIVAVPAYPPKRNQKMSRLEAIVKDAQGKFLLTTKSLLSNIEERLAKNMHFTQLKCIPTDILVKEKSSFWKKTKLNRDTLAFLQYTSGSTGTPKGVMVSHANIIYNQQMIKQAFEYDEKSIGVSWLPLFHDMGLIGNVFQPLYLGRLSILMSPTAFLQKPIRWLKAISRYRATSSGGPNFAYDLCVNRISLEQKKALDLSSWKVAFNGSERVRPETLERFSKAFAQCGFRAENFSPCYGMAETTLLVSAKKPGHQTVFKKVSSTALHKNKITVLNSSREAGQTLVGCGQTLLEQEIIIVDPNTHVKCPPENIGEIWVTGKNVARGYWNNEVKTLTTFSAHISNNKKAYLRTGDLGFLDHNGELFITGRLKEIIILNGLNYYPQDIELVAEKSHPALRANSGAAFSVEIEGQERLIIVYEVERTYLRKFNIQEIGNAVRSAVSKEFELNVYNFSLLKTNSILKTSSGKIQRRECCNSFLNKRLNVIGQDELTYLRNFQKQTENTNSDFKVENTLAPSTEIISQWLITELSKYLQIESINLNVDKPLFEYGLSSVDAIQLLGKLQEWLGISLPVTLLYDNPTIKNLSTYLSNVLNTNINLAPIAPNPLTSSLPTLNLQSEVILDPTIELSFEPIQTNLKYKNIFLSGATGFLGAFLLNELLNQTDATIYCLVRASNVEKARKRIKENLKSYFLWDKDKNNRIIPVPGDISQPRLGVTNSTFQSLANDIDAIYHSAAQLNFIFPYTSLKSSNVIGTQEVIRLASLTKKKVLHYISTTAVFESRAYRGKVVKESDPLVHSEDMYLGYSQSKWVAEKMIHMARKRGLPVNIYRPGLISGDSLTGAWNTDDVTCRFFKGCIQLGYFPNLNWLFDLSPVDYVAKAIIILSHNSQMLGENFHLQHPEPIFWSQAVKFIRELDYPIKLVSYQSWLKALLRKSQSPGENALSSLLPFFANKCSIERLTIPELYQECHRPIISCQQTLTALTQISNLTCPIYTLDLFKTYFSYFTNSGFLTGSNAGW